MFLNTFKISLYKFIQNYQYQPRSKILNKIISNKYTLLFTCVNNLNLYN